MTTERYAELFRTESREHLSVVNDALLDLERGHASADAVASLFRAVHSMKGMAGAMGYVAVAELAHEMESLLEGLRSGRLQVSTQVTDALFAAADLLEEAVAAAIGGTDGRADCQAVIERLRALASDGARAQGDQSSGGGAAPRAGTSARDADGPAGWLVEVRQSPGTPMRGARAMLLLRKLADLGEVVEVAPPAAELLADAYDGRFSVRLLAADGVDGARIEEVARSAGDVAEVLVSAPGDRTGAAHVLPDAAAPQGGTDPHATRSVRVDVRHLDSLLDVVGELMIAHGRLREAVGHVRTGDVGDAMGQLGRLIGDLQAEVLSARLVPVWQVFDRFPRLVRDAARTVGKEVEFVVEGKEIELDRSLLDEIGDPVVHLLRNAVDHGIESVVERLAAGKPGRGRLTLSAVRDRDAVLLRVRDDGRGIDRGKVERRARELGLLGEGEEVSDAELTRLIARAGFSTADRVGGLSGRGVGVDAVQDRLRALGGSVEMQSVAGEGMTVTLRFPLTLAIVRTLLARVGDEVYALPASHVSATAELAAARRFTVRGEMALSLGPYTVPALDLRALVGMPGSDAADRELVVVEARDRRLGLVVDELLGEQEAVVKRFDLVRGALPCFSGATVLGNGMPALIVDVGRLLN